MTRRRRTSSKRDRRADDPISRTLTPARRVEAGSAPGLSNLAHISPGGADTIFSATGVAAGSYSVRVRAVNAGGPSAPSNEVLLVVGAACSAPPSTPPGLIAQVGGPTVTLTWGAASGSPASDGNFYGTTLFGGAGFAGRASTGQ